MTLPTRIAGTQLSEILRRAAELDAQRESLSAVELQRIAAEAGIDPAATEAAIREVLSADLQDPVAPAPGRRAVRRLIGVMAVGAVIGFGGGILAAFVPEAAFPATMGVGVFALFRAVREMFRDGRFEFQLQNLGMWAGFLAGGTIGATPPEMELVMGSAFGGLVLSALIGAFIIRRGGALVSDVED